MPAPRPFANFIRLLDPGSFALVMATGIVSIAAAEHDLPRVARLLLAVNAAAFVLLLVLSLLRLVRFRAELVADFANPARGAGFLTLVAASCVLGNQFLVVAPVPVLAAALFAFGTTAWLALSYLLFASAITARRKPDLMSMLHGGWLVVVVATQAVSVLGTQLAGTNAVFAFLALTLFLLGAALYLLLITLIVYRLLFFPFAARDFTPPYWINMGALAITTLAGSLIVTHAPAHGALAATLPFVKGLTLFAWSIASWWIPLLVMLVAWRHFWHKVSFAYQVADWNMVFPIGMYTVCTFELDHALELGFLDAIPAWGVWVSLAVWAGVSLNGLRALRRR